MALLHNATLMPTKRELLTSWLPTRPWFDGEVDREPAGSFRLDDPDGEVGMEGFLLGSASGSTLFVPLTYRAAPLRGADEHLIGTSEHSVLGARWVYDACGDPVWAQALAEVILTGGTQAVEEIKMDGEMVTRESSVKVRGTGSGTYMPAHGPVACHDGRAMTAVIVGDLELVVVRRVGTSLNADSVLYATWAGGSHLVIAAVRGR